LKLDSSGVSTVPVYFAVVAKVAAGLASIVKVASTEVGK